MIEDIFRLKEGLKIQAFPTETQQGTLTDNMYADENDLVIIPNSGIISGNLDICFQIFCQM